MPHDRMKPLKSIAMAPPGMRAWFVAGSALVSAPVEAVAPNPSSRAWSPLLHICPSAGDTAHVVAEEIVAFLGVTRGARPPFLAKDDAALPSLDLDALPVFEGLDDGFVIDAEALAPLLAPAGAPNTNEGRS